MNPHRIVHICFSAAVAVFSVFVWYSAWGELNAQDIIAIAAAMTCSVSVLVLSAVIFSKYETYAVFAAFLIPYIAIAGYTWPYLLIAFLSLLMFVVAVAWVRSMTQSRITLSFYPLVGYGTPMMLTAIALLFACTAYFRPVSVDTLATPSWAVDVVVPMLEPVVSRQFPGYQPGMTVDELIEASVMRSLEGVDVKKLPKGELAKIEAAIAEQKAGLKKQLGFEFTGKENFQELLLGVSNSYLNRYLGSYKEFIPLLVAVFVFLSIKSFGFLIDRAAVLGAWLLAAAMRAMGILHKEKVAAEKEVLVVRARADKVPKTEIPLRP